MTKVLALIAKRSQDWICPLIFSIANLGKSKAFLDSALSNLFIQFYQLYTFCCQFTLRLVKIALIFSKPMKITFCQDIHKTMITEKWTSDTVKANKSTRLSFSKTPMKISNFTSLHWIHYLFRHIFPLISNLAALNSNWVCVLQKICQTNRKKEERKKGVSPFLWQSIQFFQLKLTTSWVRLGCPSSSSAWFGSWWGGSFPLWSPRIPIEGESWIHIMNVSWNAQNVCPSKYQGARRPESSNALLFHHHHHHL